MYLQNHVDRIFLTIWKRFRFDPATRSFVFRQSGESATDKKGVYLKSYKKFLTVEQMFKIYFKVIDDQSPEMRSIIEDTLKIPITEKPVKERPTPAIRCHDDDIDTRINNLEQRLQNEVIGIQAEHQSGIPGIKWSTKVSKWEVNIYIYKRPRFVGYFETLDAAKDALEKANVVKDRFKESMSDEVKEHYNRR